MAGSLSTPRTASSSSQCPSPYRIWRNSSADSRWRTVTYGSRRYPSSCPSLRPQQAWQPCTRTTASSKDWPTLKVTRFTASNLRSGRILLDSVESGHALIPRNGSVSSRARPRNSTLTSMSRLRTAMPCWYCTTHSEVADERQD